MKGYTEVVVAGQVLSPQQDHPSTILLMSNQGQHRLIILIPQFPKGIWKRTFPLSNSVKKAHFFCRTSLCIQVHTHMCHPLESRILHSDRSSWVNSWVPRSLVGTHYHSGFLQAHYDDKNIQWMHTKKAYWNILNSLPSVRRHHPGQCSRWAIAVDVDACHGSMVYFYTKRRSCFLQWILLPFFPFSSAHPFRLFLLCTFYFWSDWGPASVLCWLTGLSLLRGQACLPFSFSWVYRAERKSAGHKYTLWNCYSVFGTYKKKNKLHKIFIQGSLSAH